MEVRDFADRLDERERTVLWGHYGLGLPPQTLTKIGADLGLTAERVRQIEADALKKLRKAAADPPNAGEEGIEFPGSPRLLDGEESLRGNTAPRRLRLRV